MAERFWDREGDWERGHRYRGAGYYGGYYGYPDEREREREREYARRGDEPGLFDRLRDELRSWFSDEDARRERLRDEREAARWRGGREGVDRDWARQWGYLEGRGSGRPDRTWPRGWGYSGGYGAGAGYLGGDEYGRPTGGWGWTEPERHRRGPHAGRGPRGYQRSDDRIREDICERMCDNDDLDAREIEIRVSGGEVTLLGTVHDRYDRRLAEDIVAQVSGVQEISNQLRVVRETAPEGQPQRPEGPRYRAA
jgi:BON domain